MDLTNFAADVAVAPSPHRQFYKRVKINQPTVIKKPAPRYTRCCTSTYITVVPVSDGHIKTVITHFQGKRGGNLPHSGRWPGRAYYAPPPPIFLIYRKTH